MNERFTLPVELYITERWSGAYHGGLDWPDDKPRQEPPFFRRRRVMALIYDEPLPTSPRIAVLGDGRMVDLTRGDWYFGLSDDPKLPTTSADQSLTEQ